MADQTPAGGGGNGPLIAGIIAAIGVAVPATLKAIGDLFRRRCDEDEVEAAAERLLAKRARAERSRRARARRKAGES